VFRDTLVIGVHTFRSFASSVVKQRTDVAKDGIGEHRSGRWSS